MWNLSEEDLFLNASFLSASDAIAFAGEKLADRGYVESTYIAEMQQRHEQVSVYIGNFVALPHADVQDGNLLKEGMILIQVPDGVNFGTTNKRQIATIVVAIALKKWTQLTVLQELALFFSDLKNVRKISDATTKQEIIGCLKLAK